MFIAGEGAGGFKLRIKAWMAAHPAARPAMRLQPFPSYLDKEAEAAALIAAVKALSREEGARHRLVVVDTFSANFTGKENTDEAAAFVRACQRIALECDVTVLVLHHLGKDGEKGARGHSSLIGNTDFWMTLERPKMTERQVRLKPGKLKDAPLADPIWMEARAVPVVDCGEFADSLVLTPSLAPTLDVRVVAGGVADEALCDLQNALGLVRDGDDVRSFVENAAAMLGVSLKTAERRVGELIEAMPGLAVEKLPRDKNRRVFRRCGP